MKDLKRLGTSTRSLHEKRANAESFSGPYFPVFGSDRKKLRICTLHAVNATSSTPLPATSTL